MGTTWEAIRAQQIAKVRAIAPTKLSDVPFRDFNVTAVFREWIDTAGAAQVLRRFDVRHGLDLEAPVFTNLADDLVKHHCRIEVAYPREIPNTPTGQPFDRYADGFIDEDIYLIDDAIGLRGIANYVSGQHECRIVSTDVEESEKARLLTITFFLQYERSV